jgi:hypothetical protein
MSIGKRKREQLSVNLTTETAETAEKNKEEGNLYGLWDPKLLSLPLFHYLSPLRDLRDLTLR